MPPFRSRDAYVVLGVAAVLTLLSGTCWYFAGTSRTAFNPLHGTIVAKVTTLPNSKLPVPLGRYLQVRGANGEVISVRVDERTFAEARVGSDIDRDLYGNVHFKPKTPN